MISTVLAARIRRLYVDGGLGMTERVVAEKLGLPLETVNAILSIPGEREPEPMRHVLTGRKQSPEHVAARVAAKQTDDAGTICPQPNRRGEAMTDTERTMLRIEALLLRLVATLCPAEPPAKKSEASIASVTIERGMIRDNDSADVVPSQLEHTLVDAGVMGKSRRVVRIKDRQGDPRGR